METLDGNPRMVAAWRAVSWGQKNLAFTVDEAMFATAGVLTDIPHKSLSSVCKEEGQTECSILQVSGEICAQRNGVAGSPPVAFHLTMK